MGKWLGVIGGCALVVAGCSSSSPTNECTGETAAPLRTCAAGTTVKGIDVSIYQGTINWTSVKSSGRSFAFIRVSDGVNTPDTKFAANWPNAKSAGVIRGVYQFFRPGQDPAAQAKLLVDKMDAAGGMKPGDLPPVLDLETADGLSASAVQSKALAWLTAVEAALGVKPIVYTANFMSGTIGTAFGGYTLWVANYGATCPLMPSGWTNWHFWQDTDNGSIGGISGNVDTDLFNGTMAQLQTLTLKGATSDPVTGPGSDDVVPTGALPNDGSQGGTIGSGNPPPAETTGAPLTPCQ